MVEHQAALSRRSKMALGIALIAGTLIAISATVIAPVSYYADAARNQTPVDTFHLAAGWVAGIAGASAAITTIYALVWVIRHFAGSEQALWVMGLVLFGPAAAILWWWRVIRPLPEGD